MKIKTLLCLAVGLLLTGCATDATRPQPQTTKSQVWPGNGKAYPLYKGTNGVAYLAVPPEDIILSKDVPAPSAPSSQGTSIAISISGQRAWLFKNGELEITSVCCPGRPGHETPTGTFHIVDKDINHESTIYHVPMPYMMRLSTPQEDVGIHQGYICATPASHGCIRLPRENAILFFQSTPVGSKVVITP